MKKQNLLHIIALVLVLITPQVSQAITVQADLNLGNSKNSITIINFQDIIQEDGSIQIEDNKVYARGVRGNVFQSISKEVNLKSGISNLPQIATVPAGNTITLDSKPSQGAYVITGSSFDTPPMDGIVYDISSVVDRAKDTDILLTLADLPRDEGNIILTSSNPSVIECIGNTCSAKSVGRANITISFENNKALTKCEEGRYWNNGGLNPVYQGFGQGNILFSGDNENYLRLGENKDYFCTYNGAGGLGVREEYKPAKYRASKLGYSYTYPDLQYEIRVTGGAENNAPVAEYIATDSIEVTSASPRWKYTDADRDIQTGSHLQISTSPEFLASDIVYNKTLAGSVNRIRVDGLTPNTLYYPRVRVSNQVNGNSAWAVGPAFTTKDTNTPIGEGIIPLHAYTSTTTGVETAPVKVEAGKEFTLSWYVKPPTKGSPGAICEGLSSNFPPFTTGSFTNPNLYSVYAKAPKDPGEHTYQLKCVTEYGIPELRPIPKGYTRGIIIGWNSSSYILETAIDVVSAGNASLDFSINDKTEDFTVNAEEELNFKWKVENPDRVSECTAETRQPGGSSTSDINWNGDRTRQGGTEEHTTPPTNKELQYTFTLTCKGQNGGKTVGEDISVTVNPKPLITCDVTPQLLRGKDTPVTITGTLANKLGTKPFTWTLDDGIGNSLEKPNTEDEVVSWVVDYAGVGIRRITPKITFKDSSAEATTITCTTITSLGDGPIKEVTP